MTTPKLGDGSVTGAKLGSIVVRLTEVTVTNGSGNAGNAACAPGERLIGGGARMVGSLGNDFQLTSSRPRAAASDDPTDGEAIGLEWRAAGFNPAGGVGDNPLKIFAICLQ